MVLFRMLSKTNLERGVIFWHDDEKGAWGRRGGQSL